MDEMKKYKTATDILKHELTRRTSINSSYSMRAFARDIGVAPSMLSEVLRGKKKLSTLKAKSICKNLDFKEDETKLFMEALNSTSGDNEVLTIDSLADYESIISIEHIVCLEIIGARSFITVDRLTQLTGLSSKRCHQILTDLKKLKLIELGTKGLKRNHQKLIWDKGTPSYVVKKFHSDVLNRAKSALFDQGTERREFSASLVPVSKARLEEARAYLRQMRQEFISKFSAADHADSIYTFAFQLYENTKGEL